MDIEGIANELTQIAYRLDSMRRHQATAEGLKTTNILLEAAAILRTHPDAEPNGPLTLKELRAVFYNEEGPVWVNVDAVFVPAVLDVYDGVLVAVWSACGIDTALVEKDYGKTWLAYRRKPEEERK